MPVRSAVDTVLLLHFAFIAFVMLGALLVIRWRWIIVAHVPAVIWGAFIEATGGICPLTPIENRLRSDAICSCRCGHRRQRRDLRLAAPPPPTPGRRGQSRGVNRFFNPIRRHRHH
jgi:hypothetical protein